MRELEREPPSLCPQCQQWLCSNRDRACSSCGASLVAATYSAEQLVFTNNSAALTITNTGIFRLYWAAEILSPAPATRALFAIRPDYGIVSPGQQQAFLVTLIDPLRRGVRAQLAIVSNDSRCPEVKLELVL